MLALAIAVAVGLAGTLRSFFSLEGLLVVGFVVLLAFVFRGWLIRRELARRVVWSVLPADEFNPVQEHIDSFGRQLGEARLAILAVFCRPASAIRVRLSSVGEGGMQYGLSAPHHGRGVIEGAMYGKVELRRADEIDPGSGDLLVDAESEGDGVAARRLADEALAASAARDEAVATGTDLVVRRDT